MHFAICFASSGVYPMVWMISASIAYCSGDHDGHLVWIGHASFPVRASQFSVEHSIMSSLMRFMLNSFELESSAGPNYLREISFQTASSATQMALDSIGSAVAT
jgi:hypothetical protein